MATSPWYRGGTAKFTSGSTTVTGTDTEWVRFVRAGDGIQGPDGKLYQITNVSSNTSLSIFPAYGGDTSYWTIPIQGYVKQLADTAAQLVRDFEGGAVEAIDAANRAKQSAIDAEAQKNAAATEADRAEATMGFIDGRANAAANSAVQAGNSANQSLNEANRSKAEAERAKTFKSESETLYEMTSIAAGEALEHVSSLALMQKQILDIDWVIPTGYNALVIGDLTVNPGVTVTGVGTATLRGL